MPAVNIELSVCVFRAKSMTEQQEQSEETGLVSTQDLDPSKDDDTHGHFRQISHTNTHTVLQYLLSFPALFFHPHTICILCMVMGCCPRRFIFTALILCFYFSRIWSQTIAACTQTKRPQTEFTKDPAKPLKAWRKDMWLENFNCCTTNKNVLIHFNMFVV